MMMKKKNIQLRLLLLVSMAVVGGLLGGGPVAMAAPKFTVQPVEVVYTTTDRPGEKTYQLWLTVPSSAVTGNIDKIMTSTDVQYQQVIPLNRPYVFSNGIDLVTTEDNVPVEGTFTITYKAQQSSSIVGGTYTVNLNQGGTFTPYQSTKLSADGALMCEFQVTNDTAFTPSRPEIIIICANKW